MEKNFIFYSDHCVHSKKLLEILSKNNLLDNYELCCVDNSEIELPQFVDSVPILYNISQKRIIKDQSLLHFINIELNRNTQSEPIPQQQMPQQQIPQQQMPEQQMPQQQNKEQGTQDTSGIGGFFKCEMGGSFSDSYSYIEGNKQIEHSYSFINPQDNSNTQENIQPQLSDTNFETKQSKGALMDKAYENMMKQRAGDMPKPMSQMRI